jgi:hypothetical protein
VFALFAGEVFVFALALLFTVELAFAVLILTFAAFVFVFAAGVVAAAGRAPLNSFGLLITFWAKKFSILASFIATAAYD